MPPVPVTSKPVEMSELGGPTTPADASRPSGPDRFVTAAETPAILQQSMNSPSALATRADGQTDKTAQPPANQSSNPDALVAMPDDSTPAVLITLLLPSTGTRHAFRIDSQYIKQRSAASSTPASPTLAQAVDGAADAVAGKMEAAAQEPREDEMADPWNISVYTLKELIWRDWRDDWELRPTSPSAIRLIHFGRLLDDKSALGELKFNHTSTNMVHMSVRPADLEDDDATGGKLGKVTSRSSGYRSRRSGNNGNNNTTDQNEGGTERTSPGCRCNIM